MPSSLNPPSLLGATRALLSLRFHITRRGIERSPAAQAASLLALVLVCPAAFQVGGRAGRLLASAPAQSFSTVCSALLLLTLLYVTLLLAGSAGLGGVMEPPPETVLRALPVPRGATLLADAVSLALSFPTLFFVAAMVPMAKPGTNAMPLVLLGAFALCLALLLGRVGSLIVKRGRAGFIVAGASLILFAGLVLRATPAAALSSVLEEKKPPVRLPWDPPAPSPPAVPTVLRFMPPGLVAQYLTGSGNPAFALLALAATFAATATGTILLDRANERVEPASDAKPNRAHTAPRSAGPVVTEARLLLRNPAAHTRLRGPASLLLTIGYAWIAPNLGRDAVRNLADLLGMGITLYLAIWQIQFVCNRFGSEAGSAATLFSLPRERWRILLAKNLALFALLFVLDGAALSGFAVIAGNPSLIPTLLFALVPILALLTALGNVISVLSPFPLPRKMERFEREPERSLLFVYGVIAVGTWLLFLPVLMLGERWGVMGYGLGAGYVIGIYAASVALVTKLLSPAHEQRLISLLDGVK